jgi:hypothetical protein
MFLDRRAAEVLLRLPRWQAQPGQPDRVFNPDSSDRRLVSLRRGDHNRLGFALQLTACGSWAPFRRDVPPRKRSCPQHVPGVSAPVRRSPMASTAMNVV